MVKSHRSKNFFNIRYYVNLVKDGAPSHACRQTMEWIDEHWGLENCITRAPKAFKNKVWSFWPGHSPGINPLGPVFNINILDARDNYLIYIKVFRPSIKTGVLDFSVWDRLKTTIFNANPFLLPGSN